jgi:hypothetical protein
LGAKVSSDRKHIWLPNTGGQKFAGAASAYSSSEGLIAGFGETCAKICSNKMNEKTIHIGAKEM